MAGWTLAARRWAPHAIALFVSVHLLAVLVDVVPYPTHRLDAVKKITDAREEVDRALSFAHAALGKPGTFSSFKRRAFAVVEHYRVGVVRARGVVGPYLATVGSSQRWNMFAGVPPRHPIVAVLEVVRCDAEDADEFEVWLDGHAGRGGDDAFDFRERKAQETLYLAPDEARRAYARHRISRWDREHPEQPIRALRLRYVETTTQRAAEVGARRPARDKVLASVVVSAPEGCR